MSDRDPDFTRAITPTGVGTIVGVVILLIAAACLAQTPLDAGQAEASPEPPASIGVGPTDSPGTAPALGRPR
jgi:hypothetical protein